MPYRKRYVIKNDSGYYDEQTLSFRGRSWATVYPTRAQATVVVDNASIAPGWYTIEKIYIKL